MKTNPNPSINDLAYYGGNRALSYNTDCKIQMLLKQAEHDGDERTESLCCGALDGHADAIAQCLELWDRLGTDYDESCYEFCYKG